MHTPTNPIDRLDALLAGKNIGLSISDNADRTQRGFDRVHQGTFMYELARTLFRFGASISYGGHLRNEGFTVTSLQHLIDEQQTALDDQRIRSYVAWPLYCRTPTSQDDVQEEFLKFAEFVRTDPPTNLRPSINKNDFLESKLIPDRFYWFRSLTEMRHRMNSEIDARVVLGGKLRGYVGRYPGVVEEVLIAVACGMPVYVCGGFGGAAGALARLFLGESVPELDIAYQYGDPQYVASASYYEAFASDTLGSDLEATTRFDRFVTYAVDYSLMCEFFRAVGIEGLNNGLSHDENMILFETPSLDEMRMLILSGLTRLFATRGEHASPAAGMQSNSESGNSEPAFKIAVQRAGLPRSPLIDDWQSPRIVSTGDLLAIESEMHSHLGDRYSEIRRSIISQHSFLGSLEQFDSISNARSLLSLDLSALNWQGAQDGPSPVTKFLVELAKSEPRIENSSTVRKYLPHGEEGRGSELWKVPGDAAYGITQNTPDEVVWYVQVQSADGKQLASEGSAVAIRLRRKDGTQQPKTCLLTCAHVVRGRSADGEDGFGPVLSNIRVWAPGTGQTEGLGKAAKINAEIKRLPDGDVQTAERRNAAEDWVVLDICDSQAAAAAHAVRAWAVTNNGDRYHIWGYPGGDSGFSKGIVNPTRTPQPYQFRSESLGVVQLTGDGTRPGNSGGGVFTENGEQFVGIHRARTDATLQLHAVSAQHIFDRLRESGFELADTS